MVERARERACSRRRWRSWAVEMLSFREVISEVVVPKRVIFVLLEDSRGRRVVRGVSLKGGFCIPGFGLIMIFWFSGGTERVSLIAEERSLSVDSGERAKSYGSPW